MAIELTCRSVVAAPPDVVWERAGRVSGMNDELWPFARMTCPAHLDRIASPPHAVGQPMRTWMLVLRVLPIERRTIQFDLLEEGRFVDCSTGWLNGRWRHDRSVVAHDEGSSLLVDDLVLEPRLRLMGVLVRPSVRLTFRWRHRRLRRHFR